jgi:hypothetical protein
MKIFKIILIFIFAVVFVLLNITCWQIENAEAFGNIATFLSISIGFNITALSIIATSPFAKRLYTIEDENDNSKTLLHVLVGRVKSTTIIFVICLALILLYSFFGKNPFSWEKMHISHFTFYFRDIIRSLVWFSTIMSVTVFISLIYLFSSFVIKSASSN